MKVNKTSSEDRAEEQLRQERDAFDQQKWIAKRWFVFRQLAVSLSMLVLLAILAFAIYVVTRADLYPWPMVCGAGTAIFGEILYAMVFVWKTALSPEWSKALQPITIVQGSTWAATQ